jgi:hypothetical protein
MMAGNGSLVMRAAIRFRVISKMVRELAVQLESS